MVPWKFGTLGGIISKEGNQLREIPIQPWNFLPWFGYEMALFGCLLSEKIPPRPSLIIGKKNKLKGPSKIPGLLKGFGKTFLPKPCLVNWLPIDQNNPNSQIWKFALPWLNGLTLVSPMNCQNYSSWEEDGLLSYN